jgi:hypothetical protein
MLSTFPGRPPPLTALASPREAMPLADTRSFRRYVPLEGDQLLGAHLIAAKASTCSRKSGCDNCCVATVLLSGEGVPK